MQALWIHPGPTAAAVVEPLPVPFRRIAKPIDPEVFRRQARGEDIGRPRLHAGTALSCRSTTGVHDDGGPVAPGRGLVFVISGEVALQAGDGRRHVLAAGDMYFQDDAGAPLHRAVCSGECRLMFLGVADHWQPAGEIQAPGVEGRGAAGRRPVLRRMYKAADDKSYFRDFAHLFASGDQWSAPRPVAGFHFVHFPPGFFIDWHPEAVNNLVVVMTGELELEVSGDRRIEVFAAGDVCLAEDRTGEGHIDRVHGDNRMVLIVMEDENLWALPA